MQVEPLQGLDWLAATLGISKPTIYRYRTTGQLDKLPPSVKIAGQLKWRPSVVAKWIEDQEGINE